MGSYTPPCVVCSRRDFVALARVLDQPVQLRRVCAAARGERGGVAVGGGVSDLLTYPEAARIVREAVKDKSYRAFPMGGESGAYLRWKRGVIAPATYRTYESILDKLSRAFPDLEIADFEPPVGTERLEEWMDGQWGGHAPGTYNTCLAIISDFFKWAVLKGKLHGDPTLPMRRRKKGGVHRTVFSEDSRLRILALGPEEGCERRDRLCLRLLLDYGVRKGGLLSVQFRMCDPNRRTVTVFTKGRKVQTVQVVDPAWWDDFEKLSFEIGAQPHWFLLWSRHTGRGNRPNYDRPYGSRGAHEWWYRCLQRAEVVDVGVTAGERMHKARHTAGQRILDKTGNIKAVQKQLGHASPTTTMETYVDWDDTQLAETLREVLLGE